MNTFSEFYYYRPSDKKQNEKIRADLCVYGGTSAGVAAAVQAARLGLRTVIMHPGRFPGGLSAGGLGATDIGNKAAIGGLSRQFYRQILEYYHETEEAPWVFEPHAAAEIYRRWIEQEQIPVYRQAFLEKVDVENGRITCLHTENGLHVEAAAFIDATYEGDLMAAAGVSYRVGREANRVYQETLNGIHFGHPNHDFRVWVDPYRVEGKPDSGLLPGVKEEAPGIQGEGDSRVQAYNFRICLSRKPERIPFPEPPAYDPAQYELLARYLKAGIWDAMALNTPLPNGKTDLNNHGAVSTDFIGENYGWPEGSYAQREEIFQKHFRYALGMLYFLQNDKKVPDVIHDEMQTWGLAPDEFTATGHWPHELYIREARRMVSDYVNTEKDCLKLRQAEDPVALAAYQMDSHNCRRIVLDGRCVNEGNVEVQPAAPFEISYRSIVPKKGECRNLLVPVCVSASHIAYGSLRMEPVFMVLGQSAATAAALALKSGRDVQEVDYQQLRARLLRDGQILSWQD